MKTRRRTFAATATSISVSSGTMVEALEHRQLLSATNLQQQVTVSEDVVGSDHALHIEEVHRVDDQIWVLSRLTSPTFVRDEIMGVVPEDILYLEDEAEIRAFDFPIREFRIGGFGYENAATDRSYPTQVDSVTEFHELLNDQSSEQLYARIDPALSEWRDTIVDTLLHQADEAYGENFGNAAPERPVWILPVIDLPEWLRIEALAETFAVADSALAATASLSDTNVQVEGVDEADIVETDGDYIYTISNRRELVVLQVARDGRPAGVVSRTDLNVRPTAMFLHNGRLTVISHDNVYEYGSRLAYFENQRSRTSVTVLDVSSPETPTLVQESVVDGRFQNARAIGEQVYIVISNNSSIPYLPSLNDVADPEVSTGRRYETRLEYVRRLNLLVHGDGNGQPGLTPPSVYQRTMNSDGTENLQRLGWLDGSDELVGPESGQFTSVVRFDAGSSHPGPVDNIGVYHRRYSDSTIYASTNAIYLVATEFEQVENDGLFIVPGRSEASSRIHKIDISSDQMIVGASGTVPGIVESQFSLDEHDGYLRIATTTGNTWDGTSLNHLFVLEDVGDELLEVGSVNDLALSERIYSVRFDGDRAWMVTFRQVDPVYSFDLSDPTNPAVTGELKITGYSEYLQLIDENLLLAIGRSASDDGRLEEVQVSLFDVSDMTAPSLLDRYSFDGDHWGHSSALFDHHAFHYLPDHKILAVPYFASERTLLPTGQSLTFLDVDATDGIRLRGELPTQVAVDVQRSVQIDDLLYAISGSNARIVDLADVETVLADIPFDDAAVSIGRREDLANAIGKAIDVRRYFNDEGAEELRIELREVLGDLLPNDVAELEYEFRAVDLSGVERLRTSSTEPVLKLVQSASNALAAGTYNFQMRTRSRLLENADWANWTPGTAATILSEKTEMLSAAVLREGQRMLRWSTVADRVSANAQNEGQAAFEVNPVSHFELWLSDASKRETLLWLRDLQDAEYDVSDLSPATYWAWFRPVFQDGTIGEWSRRQQFDVLADKLNLRTPLQYTANKRPTFDWDAVDGVTSFEVEVMSADGATTVYSARDLLTERLEFSEDLSAGSYMFRVRAAFASGGFSDWTDLHTFTVVDRPQVSIVDDAIQWDDNGAERHELWISRVGSTEPLVHQTDLNVTQIQNAVSALGLGQAGRFSVWVKSFLPDGSRTAWSSRVTLQQFAEAVSVTPIADVLPGNLPTIAWAAGDGIESYEIYVQNAGQSGAVYRLADITELSHTLPEQLARGRYVTWVRGAFADGGFTKWGQAHVFNVADRLEVSFADDVLSWVSTNTESDIRYEVWINRVDDRFRLLTSKVMHFLDVVGRNVSIDLLPDGNYSAWVREIRTVDGEAVKSAWSERANFEVSPIDDLIDAFRDGVDELLDLI